MADAVRLVDPTKLRKNPENPRLIFRQNELDDLQKSIASQGILVPLTVFKDRTNLVILDGERRWLCSLKLALTSVPVIVQPKPNRLQNLMMMFAIHNARRDWDPLPTALKLDQLEREFSSRHRRSPTETELAGLASISRGEVRRLKKLLALPPKYRAMLLRELEKPRADQVITVDHVLETTRGAEALRKRGVIDRKEEDRLRHAILAKFRSGVEKNTVAPRKLARLARAVDRKEVSTGTARRITLSLIRDPQYSIEDGFRDSVEQADYEHGVVQIANRLLASLDEHRRRKYKPSPEIVEVLQRLRDRITQFGGG